MREHSTIAEAAHEALRSLARPSNIQDIYLEILRLRLYQFNTPTPEHVPRTTIRRHTGDVERVDSSEEILFEMLEPEIYCLASATKYIPKKRQEVE